MMLVGLLLLALAVPSSAAQVFPDGLCEDLPAADASLAGWVAGIDPERARHPVRVLPEDRAVDLFARAAEAGIGSVQLFTRDAFRQPCTVYLSRDVLRAIDQRFRLDLLTEVRGEDEQGKPFEMVALLGGRGKLTAVYDRDGIVYYNEREDRSFGLDAQVELATPGRGRLENIDGLCAEVALLGCLDIESMVQTGDTITVTAGPFTADSASTPIEDRAEGGARD